MISNTKPISYRCRICGCERTAQASLECDEEGASKIAKLLTCDRCFDFHVQRGKAIDRIKKAAMAWLSQTQSNDPSAEVRNASRETIRLGLIELATIIANKAFAQTYARWDDVEDVIMERPAYVLIALREFERLQTKHHRPQGYVVAIET